MQSGYNKLADALKGAEERKPNVPKDVTQARIAEAKKAPPAPIEHMQAFQTFTNKDDAVCQLTEIEEGNETQALRNQVHVLQETNKGLSETILMQKELIDSLRKQLKDQGGETCAK